MSTTFERVKSIVDDLLACDAQLDTTLREAECDEMDLIELAMAIEEEFARELPDETVAAWRTVGDIVATAAGNKRMNSEDVICQTCDTKELIPFEHSPGYYRCRRCGTDYKIDGSRLVCIFFPAFADVFRSHWKRHGKFLYKLSKCEYNSLLAQAQEERE